MGMLYFGSDQLATITSNDTVVISVWHCRCRQLCILSSTLCLFLFTSL